MDRQDLDESGEDVEDGCSIERPGSAPPTLELNSTNLFSFGTEQTKLFSDIRCVFFFFQTEFPPYSVCLYFMSTFTDYSFEEDYAAFYQSVGGTQEGLPPPLNPVSLVFPDTIGVS